MKKISELLGKFLTRQRIVRPMEAVRVCALASKVGRHSHPQFRGKSFRKGLLTIEADDSVAGQKLELQKEEIRKLLNQKLGSETIKKIRVKVKIGERSEQY